MTILKLLRPNTTTHEEVSYLAVCFNSFFLFGLQALPLLLIEPAFLELLSELVSLKLSGKDGGGSVSFCGWVKENGAAGDIKLFITADTVLVQARSKGG